MLRLVRERALLKAERQRVVRLFNCIGTGRWSQSDRLVLPNRRSQISRGNEAIYPCNHRRCAVNPHFCNANPSNLTLWFMTIGSLKWLERENRPFQLVWPFALPDKRTGNLAINRNMWNEMREIMLTSSLFRLHGQVASEIDYTRSRMGLSGIRNSAF